MPDQLPFTVLCVDDHPDNLASLSIILRNEGYRVIEARTGADALVQARQADLVILDVSLPDHNGFDICQRIKADSTSGFVPVVLLSGHFTRSEDKAEGLEGGGDAYFTKPADPRELLGQIKALLRTRRAELMLRQQARILDEIHDAVIATDLQGCVTRWNKGAERLFGYTAEEMRGQPVALLDVPSSGEPAFLLDLAALRAVGRLEREKHVRKKSGEEFYVHSSFSLLRDRHGEVNGVVGYSIDITDKRRLEEQYRRAQRLEAVGQLAGGVAHDFNNLLTIVNGFAEVLLSSLDGNEPLQAMVLEIRKAGERAAALTQQLLAFSRKQILQQQVTDMNHLVSDMQPALQRAVGDRIAVTIRPDAQLGEVRVDPAQIRLAVLNLAVNAADAMPTGGSLTLATRNVEVDWEYARQHVECKPGSYVLLAVTDSGAGMTDEIKRRIFEPFFTTKPPPAGGSGLGLAMVYGIVKQSGGHIEVESQVGAGTTFKIYLPRLPQPEPR